MKRDSQTRRFHLLRMQGFVTMAEAARRTGYTYSAVQQMVSRNCVESIRLSPFRVVVKLTDVQLQVTCSKVGRKRTVVLPVAEVKKLYEAGHGIVTLAQRYGCSRKVILVRLREAGVTIRSAGRPARQSFVSSTVG